MSGQKRIAAGLRRFMWQDARRGRPVMADVWYPAAGDTSEADYRYGLGQGRVAENAALAESAPDRPLVLMSHGAGGSAGSYGWLAEYLARNGFVVLGVSQHGESPAYGPETIDPKVFSQLWLRPADVTFALDQLLAHAQFASCIDRGRIAALGHSSGGATVVFLAGGVFDPAALASYCRSAAGSEDRGCDYARAATGRPTLPAEATRSYRDPRVRAIVALDPAAGPGFSDASLAAIDVPALIVGAIRNDFLPFHQHAGRYAALIPTAKLIPLHDGEGHFVYLNACDSPAAVNGVALCRDRPGVDRAAVHARLAPSIVDFLSRALDVTAG